jgi:plasmid stabilization system protein ParE
VKVRFSRPAQKQADRLDRWWREHRSDTADLFARELEIARQTLLVEPNLGQTYIERRGVVVRRLLLPKTHNHVYYEYDDESGMVMILAVWGAPKERGPKL